MHRRDRCRGTETRQRIRRTVREIVLDTETTGLDPNNGHRVVEIGCLELMNHVPSGRTYHCYINPERDMPAEAFAVHGLSEDFLATKPLFAELVDELMTFLSDSPLVIHNAEFDMRFLNAELKRSGRPLLDSSRAIDTVGIARRKFPGAPASLDALCRRFAIDNSARTLHGALLDAELLAEVYLELIGGRQPGLSLAVSAGEEGTVTAAAVERPYREPRPHGISEVERTAHRAFLDKLKEPIWLS